MALQQQKKTITSTSKQGTQAPKSNVENDFAFGRENYILMCVGVLVLIIGFMLMAGGNPADGTSFSIEIFSTRRITVAPIVIIIGFAIEVAAIVYKSKE